MNKIDNINNAVLEGVEGPYSLPSGYTGGTGKSTSTSTSINTGIALDTDDFTLEVECQASDYGGEAWNIMQSTESGLGDNGQIGFCGRSPYVYYNNISNNANTYLNTGIYDDTDDVEYDIVTKINTNGLPAGYTKLEYIEGTGTQYINTGIKANSAYTYKLKVSRKSPYNYNIFGIKENSSYSAGTCLIIGWTGTDYIGAYSHTGTGSGANPHVVQWIADQPFELEFNPTGEVFNVDGVNKWTEIKGSSNTNLTNASFTSNLNIYLFGTNTVGSFVGGGKSRWYSYQVYNGSTLLQNLIPAKNSNNVIGMYDTVSDTFFTNQGSGIFTAGPTITNPWYIFQSKGGNVGNNIAGLSGDSSITGLVVTTQGNSSVASSIGTLNSSDWYHINFKHKNGTGTLQVTNLDHPATATDTFTYTDYAASDTPICLFGNVAGDRAAANNSIMSVKLIKNDVVVMDYEPVTYNNTAGFYDKVSRTFKTAASGSLVANITSGQYALSASVGSTLLLSNLKRHNTHVYFLCLEYKDNVATFRAINETTGEVDTVSANVPYSSITGYSAPVYVFGDGSTRTTADTVTVYHTRIRKDGALVLDGVIASRTSPSSTGGIYNFASSSFITRSGGSITVSGGIRQGTFYENKYITSVDLSNTAWYNNSMYLAFRNCTSLTTVSNINNAVTNMQLAFGYCNSLTNVATLPTSVTDLSGTFIGCISLTDAPTIPSSVASLNSTFERCTSLVNVPTLPSSITDLSNTFRDCTGLVNAPVIPSSVTTMSSTFRNCASLTGDIVINSSVVNSVSACFTNTTLDKYVYIPYNSTTYNTFVAAGYDEVGTKEGVYLRDLSSYQG